MPPILHWHHRCCHHIWVLVLQFGKYFFTLEKSKNLLKSICRYFFCIYRYTIQIKILSKYILNLSCRYRDFSDTDLKKMLLFSTHVDKKTWAVLQDVSNITQAPLALLPPLGTCPPIRLPQQAHPPPTCKIKIIKSVSEDQAECVIFVGLLGILMVLLLPSPVLD